MQVEVGDAQEAQIRMRGQFLLHDHTEAKSLQDGHPDRLAAADFPDGSGLNPGLLEGAFKGFPRGGPRFAQHEGVSGQFLQPHHLSLGQRVRFEGEQHQRLLGEGGGPEPRVVLGLRQHRNVHPEVEQGFEHCLGIPGLDAQFQPRIAGVGGRQHLGDVIRPHRANPQGSRLKLPCRVQQSLGLALHRVQPRGDGVKLPPQRGQFHPPPTAEEQLDAVEFLQRPHLTGDGGLPHPQHPRGRREAPFLRNGVEGADLRECDLCENATSLAKQDAG